MAHVLAAEPESAEERLLERQDDREPVHRGRQPPRALRPPGPELRRDVVQDLGARRARRLGHPQVKAGIVDQDDEVVAAGAEILPQRAQEPEMCAAAC